MKVYGKAPLLYRFGALVLPWYFKRKYKLQVKGFENVPLSGKLIIASNHVTYSDPIFLGMACKRQVSFIAKEELFKNKFVSFILKKLGAFPVLRGTGDEDALFHAYEILEDEGALGIFLEGTRSKTGELLRPKTGVSAIAYKSNCTVLPVSITSKDGKVPQKKVPVMINIGKPISIEELDMEEAKSHSYRKASKYIMSKITNLREESLTLLNKEN